LIFFIYIHLEQTLIICYIISMSSGTKFNFDWPFFGNKHIIDFLQASIHNNKLAHFYIFTGAQDLGKGTLANFFASSLLCRNFSDGKGPLPCGECPSCRHAAKGTHSDVTFLKRPEDKKNISIDQIRDFIKMMNLGSFSGFYKIGIIKEGENLSIEAANALLKTLEEPKPGVVIILHTSMLEWLPGTIASRGQILHFRPVARERIYDYLISQHKVSRDFALDLSSLAKGRPALAAKLFYDKDFFDFHKKTIKYFIQGIQSGLNEKFSLAEELLNSALAGDKETKQGAREIAGDILEIWQTVVRDLILLQFNLEELIINRLAMPELKKINFSLNRLREISEKIKQGREYLAANVSPKLVLENVNLQI